ncbi:MAG: hypothetical protein ACRDDZ_01315 [Marinifilaceae bacterium]
MDKLIQRLIRTEAVIQIAFNNFIDEVSPELRKYRQVGNKGVWVRNAAIEGKLDKSLETLQTDLIKLIRESTTDAWKISNGYNDEMVKKYIQGMAIPEITKRGMFNHGLSQLKVFQDREDYGMDLSKRIWNLADETKSQLEFFLESGISTGRSAQQLSKDIRQILHEPDKLFRRVRNGEGILIESNPMKEYRVGRGVYKSSYMNALRVGATETNMAYRAADHERWMNMGFVVGKRISLSANHDAGCPICSTFVGDYPKEFKFVGWHPWCKCICTPIKLEGDDYIDYLFDGKISDELIIKDIPKQVSSYVEDHKQDFLRYRSKPYWVRDNFTYKNNSFNYNHTQVVQTSVIKAFVPAKSIKEANEYAYKNNLASNIDYKGLKLECANEWNKSIYEHLQIFPQLRDNLDFIGSIQNKNRYVIQRHIIESINRNDQIWQYCLRISNNDIEKAKKLLESRLKKTLVKKVNSNVYAVSTSRKFGSGVSVNSRFGNDIELFRKHLNHDVAEKYSPIGCNTIKSVIDHELGHEIDKLFSLSKKDYIVNLFKQYNRTEIKDQLSEYASTNINEFIAEAWSEYLNNPSPRSIAKLIGDYILNQKK